MKVYIVSAGCYSDWHICGIFSTREGAQKWIDDYAPSEEGFNEYNDIAEWTVDEELGERWRPYMVISQIESVEVAAVEDGEGSGPLDGKVERVPLSHLESDQMRKSWRLDVGVMAMDRNHAIRIAADKFREFIANGGDQ